MCYNLNMKKADKQKLTWLAVVVIIIGAIVFYSTRGGRQPGQYDEFARCLNNQGAVFYGAFWCPHCQNQKKMFGRSEKLLNYVECSTPNGQGQLAVCQEKKIEGYPTWEFADGSRESGELSLSRLAEKTGCPLAHSVSQ